MAINEGKTAHRIEIREADGKPATVSVQSSDPLIHDAAEVMRQWLNDHPPAPARDALKAPETKSLETGSPGPSAEDADMTKAVLVVDDDPAALDEMAEALGDEGISFLVASNAVEALGLAREHRPRFVLMDFNMPGMNGTDAVNAMQTFLPGATFIMISGLDDFCRVATTENTRTFAILQKPISIHNIARYIRNAFQQTGDKTLDATEMLTA